MEAAAARALHPLASSAWGSGNLLATAGDLAQARDALLSSGMEDGMTEGYERLDQVLKSLSG